jgi:type IV pilus assembly protein PilY1
VYVGSNDGMLHAINGTMGNAESGTEVFAYVPGSVIVGPSGSPTTTGLQTRGDPDFTHRYFVDGNVATFDIDFGRTQGGSGTDWRTILVGALGKGGKSYYALDITDPPAAGATEANIAAKVLWEFTDPDLGFTYGEPVALKTRTHGWVLVFGSGYNNSTGRGYFFIINPRTGALIKKLDTGEGSASNEAGLAHVQGFILDRTDGTADSLYAGDLLGNLWRVDLTDSASNYPAPLLIARLTNASGDALPVTSRPLVVVQPVTNRRWVVVGTGKFLGAGDSGSGQSQAFFAIMDGKGLRFNSAALLPTGMSFPLGRSKLRELTDLTKKVTLDTSTEIGWWFDLGKDAGLGWRVISDLVLRHRGLFHHAAQCRRCLQASRWHQPGVLHRSGLRPKPSHQQLGRHHSLQHRCAWRGDRFAVLQRRRQKTALRLWRFRRLQ